MRIFLKQGHLLGFFVANNGNLLAVSSTFAAIFWKALLGRRQLLIANGRGLIRNDFETRTLAVVFFRRSHFQDVQ
jgi:hypothetical protein